MHFRLLLSGLVSHVNHGVYDPGFATAMSMRCRNKGENTQHVKAEEELTSKGKIWIGFAAAAVVAFGLFSGQYISIGLEEDLDEDDEL